MQDAQNAPDGRHTIHTVGRDGYLPGLCIHHSFQPLPGLDPLAHSSELDCSACPHLRPMLLPARARHAISSPLQPRQHSPPRCQVGAEEPLLCVEYRPCPCVQLHHLAARDYDALSGFESRSSYYYCVLDLFWSFYGPFLVLLFLAFCGTTFLAFLALHFFLPCLDDFF